jgi:hypothetical protein
MGSVLGTTVLLSEFCIHSNSQLMNSKKGGLAK